MYLCARYGYENVTSGGADTSVGIKCNVEARMYEREKCQEKAHLQSGVGLRKSDLIRDYRLNRPIRSLLD
jgi:hypothetical protein